MTESYHDENSHDWSDNSFEYQEDEYQDEHQDEYYPDYAIDQPVWPERKFPLPLSSLIWGVCLVGLSLGTVFYFDMLPKDISNSSQQVELTADETPAPTDNPFEQKSLAETSSSVEKQSALHSGETRRSSISDVHNVVDEWDTEEKVKNRRRKLTSPAAFIVQQDDASQSWTGPTETETIQQANFNVEQKSTEKSRPIQDGTSKVDQIQLTLGEKSPQESATSSIPEPFPEPEPFPDAKLPETEHQIDLTTIDKQIKAGIDLEALRELSKLYWDRPEDRAQFEERMKAVAESIFISRQRHYLTPYEVKPGDQLAIIAKEYQVSWQYLARLNRVHPRNIRAGQKLKVIRGPFSAFIDLSDYQLTIHAHGYFVKRYPIGIGKNDSSPLGTFKVLKKLEDPTYYGPDGVVIDAKDPDNPLGERWIDIGDSFGIHGTINDKSIGKAESRGCIRMLNNDVAEVFDFLTVGSEVKIQK